MHLFYSHIHIYMLIKMTKLKKRYISYTLNYEKD